ncbi:MAG: porphobilinogen synthase, partial [Thermodesulfovibrio sp.]|nr:porphobilinogen synthase [Thermodesulfovibrio sp.]
MFPIHRPRRLRKSEILRKMVRETILTPQDFVYPVFVVPGKDIKNPISSMPECFQESVDNVVKTAKEVFSLGIPAVILFGIPEYKDEKASSAYDDKGVVQQAVRAIKDTLPDLIVITDVCLCEYT